MYYTECKPKKVRVLYWTQTKEQKKTGEAWKRGYQLQSFCDDDRSIQMKVSQKFSNFKLVAENYFPFMQEPNEKQPKGH